MSELGWTRPERESNEECGSPTDGCIDQCVVVDPGIPGLVAPSRDAGCISGAVQRIDLAMGKG